MPVRVRSMTASMLIVLGVALTGSVANAEAPQILDVAKPNYGPKSQTELLSINHIDFKEAIRLTSLVADPAKKWAVSARWTANQPIAKGDVLQVIFYLRCVRSKAEDGKVATLMTFGPSAAPFVHSFSTLARSDQEWKRYQFAFEAKADYPAGTGKLSFACGMQEQVLEIAGVEAYNYKKTKRASDFEISSAYDGIEDDAPWRKECLARIEKIRKSPLEVVVTGQDGKPITGATVSVNMKRHAFLFGSSFAPHIWSKAKKYPKEVEEYQRRFEKYFNCATPESVMCWKGWEDKQQRENLSRTLDWLEARKIPVICHPMIWQTPKTVPLKAHELVKNKDYAGYIKAWNDHLTDKVTTIRGRMCEYLVINEFVDTNYLPEEMTDPAIVNWYKIVQSIDPSTPLGILDHQMISYGAVNMTKCQAWYEKKIQMLLDNGVPLKIIGFQAHYSGTLTPPGLLLQVLDRFSKFGLDLQINELDVDMDNEVLQAKYLRDFFIAAYSHPSVTVIQQWGFYEGMHWRPGAALFRTDWSIKPCGEAFLDLVFDKWWTKATGETDSQGHYSLRAFHGDHEVTVTKGEATTTVKVKVGKPGEKVVVKL